MFESLGNLFNREAGPNSERKRLLAESFEIDKEIEELNARLKVQVNNFEDVVEGRALGQPTALDRAVIFNFKERIKKLEDEKEKINRKITNF